VNYAEQSRFFGRYRWTAAASALAVVATCATAAFCEWDRAGWREVAIAALFAAAMVYGVAYLPLYLRLSVETRKRYTWSVRARYVLVAVLALACAPATTERRPWLVWAASLAIAVAGLVATRAHLKRNRDAAELPLVPALLLAGDLAAIFLVVGLRPASTLALSAALALATMVYVVTSAGAWQAAGLAVSAIAVGLLGAAAYGITGRLPGAAVVALPVVVGGAAWTLVRAADRHHAANVERTVEELATFALVTPEYATEMLATATGILAANWRDARPVGPDAVARWYEENSEYYLYDLAQFHLAYKHIAFMRDVVALADGRVLDFGAGIGDLALELGRLGHDAVYVDVDGRTKAFARWRAERDWIPLAFASDLDEVDGEFDTIVSLDVFEHLAEPLPIVDALVDRLAPGGRMIVTAYFGATKSHPMHFDHDLDLARHLEARGLRDAKTFAMRHLRSEFLRKPGVLVFEKP
jgi:SAM-dependent methyltransferase